MPNSNAVASRSPPINRYSFIKRSRNFSKKKVNFFLYLLMFLGTLKFATYFF